MYSAGAGNVRSSSKAKVKKKNFKPIKKTSLRKTSLKYLIYGIRCICYVLWQIICFPLNREVIQLITLLAEAYSPVVLLLF